MKKLFSLFLLISALISFSCSDDATGPTTGGIGGGIGGGGTTGGVTFTVSVVQDNQQQLFFEFKPSVDAVINSITANCAAANVNNDQVTGDGTTVFNANNPAYVGPLTIIAQGQQWTFNFKGKLGSSTGTAYDVTTNYTIP
jgi:hypothetical protein